MNKTCKCGGRICEYVGFDNLAECCDCNKTYVYKDGKYKSVSKSEFRILYRAKLIEQQQSNK